MIKDTFFPAGNINKVGTIDNGKQTYTVQDLTNHKKYTYIVPQDKTDTFEKLFEESNKAITTAQSQEFSNKVGQVGAKYGKRSQALTIGSGIMGAIIPAAIAIFSKGKVWKRALFGTLGSIIGAICTGCLGIYFGTKYAIDNVINYTKNTPEYKHLEEVNAQAENLGVERNVQDI